MARGSREEMLGGEVMLTATTGASRNEIETFVADQKPYYEACAAAHRIDPSYRDFADAPERARRYVGNRFAPGEQPDGSAMRGLQAEGNVLAYREAADGSAYVAVSDAGRASVIRLSPSASHDLGHLFGGGAPSPGDFLAVTYLRREEAFILDDRRTLQFRDEHERVRVRDPDERSLEME